MTDETYSLASVIKSQISYFCDLKDLLLNSGGKDKTTHLAAIDINRIDLIVNDLYLNPEIQSKFIEVINKEIDKLDQQFEEL